MKGKKDAIDLCWAASEGDLMAISSMAAKEVLLDQADYYGRTPLHLAASNGHLEVVTYLISKNVKVNQVDDWGNTALEDAIREGHDTIIKYLKAAIF
ncbi:MAG: hypothetical protein CL521_04280 [Actinobacteria bacterium]|nr:hypothetical protein [Actinomycetota bacterium]|tara:strand:+ start:186 stop:476 length:291 start_codon:yes stop_codon:yes gene_type:complete